jgi:hypothetical protein
VAVPAASASQASPAAGKNNVQVAFGDPQFCDNRTAGAGVTAHTAAAPLRVVQIFAVARGYILVGILNEHWPGNGLGALVGVLRRSVGPTGRVRAGREDDRGAR